MATAQGLSKNCRGQSGCIIIYVLCHLSFEIFLNKNKEKWSGQIIRVINITNDFNKEFQTGFFGGKTNKSNEYF